MTVLTKLKFDHGEVAIFRHGHGPIPLLMIHGNSVDHLSWQQHLLSPSWQNSFTMYAPDLPGHGVSDPLDCQSYNLEKLAQILAGCLDQIGLEQCSYIGHSLGGHLAIALSKLKIPKLLVLAQCGPADHLSQVMENFYPIAEVGHFFNSVLTPVELQNLTQKLSLDIKTQDYIKKTFAQTDINFRLCLGQNAGHHPNILELEKIMELPKVVSVLCQNDELLNTHNVIQLLEKNNLTILKSQAVGHYGHLSDFKTWEQLIKPFLLTHG